MILYRLGNLDEDLDFFFYSSGKSNFNRINNRSSLYYYIFSVSFMVARPICKGIQYNFLYIVCLLNLMLYQQFEGAFTITHIIFHALYGSHIKDNYLHISTTTLLIPKDEFKMVSKFLPQATILLLLLINSPLSIPTIIFSFFIHIHHLYIECHSSIFLISY